MARKVIRRISRWPMRWRVLLSLVVAVGMSVVLMRTVKAVHDLGFELDGDTANNAVPDPLNQVDWNDFFTASSPADPFGGATINPLPAGFTDADLTRDFSLRPNGTYSTSDPTTYATGSKDTLPVSGWQCNQDNNVSDKTDIVNAYATAYTAPNGDQILYFAQERNAQTGDANVGFWFLQDAVNCVSPGGAVTFTGAHQDGDLLVVSAFTNGGNVSNITVYRWNIPDPTTDPIGFLDVDNPVAEGVDCRDPNGTPAGDPACATANSAPITVPWLTAAKSLNPAVGHSLPTAQFFEGGLNLTESGLGGKCFNTFISNTRASQEPSATIFDFAQGVMGECKSTTKTTPSIIGSTTIPANATIVVTDTAEVTVAGVQSFTGQVEFHLCGPFALGTTTLCDTGGVPAGTKPLTANGTVDSDPMTITSVGRYCFRADFTATEPLGIPPSHDSSDSECFSVLPLTASLITQAVEPKVPFGQPVRDTATLAGTANQPGSGGPAGSTDGSINPVTPGGPANGTITFTLFKNDCTTLATGTGLNPQTVGVAGNGVYGPVSFTPDAPGLYHWVASYSGDLPNTVGTSHNIACNDPNESVEVEQIPTEIQTKQDWIPNDTARIRATAGNLPNGGTVTFSLYANATCSGGAVFSQTVAVPGGAPTADVSTTNTGVGASPGAYRISTDYPDAANSVTAPHAWRVVYNPNTQTHTGIQSACGAERFTITYTNDPGPGTNIP